MQKATFPHLALATLALAFALLGWDLTGLDLPLAQAFGSPAGFPLRDNWLLFNVIHEGGRYLSWAAVLGLCLSVWWPAGFMARLTTSRRLQLAVTTLVSLATVSLLKSATGISCPWDLADFGGLARHMSHWTQMLQGDGGGGRCFPAGHASAGFAFISGWFVFRHGAPRVAAAWLGAALAAGFVFGIAQQMRGAHFMSHTLWTAWICWSIGWLIDLAWTRLAPQDAILAGEAA